MRTTRLILPLSALTVFAACTKESETLDLPTVASLSGLQNAKVWIYRLDSTVLPNSGVLLVTRSYQARDSVAATFTDTEGRTAYRIDRSVRDTAGTQAWRYEHSYTASLSDQNLQTVDFNNHRFLKLVSPVSEGQQWRGNSYVLPGNNNEFGYLANWDYTYSNIGASYTTRGGVQANTVTVEQRNETSPDQPFSTSLLFQEKNYSIEVYAAGKGLVYKDFLHYTWQQNPVPGFVTGSYGIRLSLISVR